jgi:hypothetical protein
VSSDVVRSDLKSDLSQKAIGTLREDGNIMPKHVGASVHN